MFEKHRYAHSAVFAKLNKHCFEIIVIQCLFIYSEIYCFHQKYWKVCKVYKIASFGDQGSIWSFQGKVGWAFFKEYVPAWFPPFLGHPVENIKTVWKSVDPHTTSPDDRSSSVSHKRRTRIRCVGRGRTRHYKVACHRSMDLASGQSRGLLHFLTSRNFLLVLLVRSRENREPGGVLSIGYTIDRSSFLRSSFFSEWCMTKRNQRSEKNFSKKNEYPLLC